MQRKLRCAWKRTLSLLGLGARKIQRIVAINSSLCGADLPERSRRGPARGFCLSFAVLAVEEKPDVKSRGRGPLRLRSGQVRATQPSAVSQSCNLPQPQQRRVPSNQSQVQNLSGRSQEAIRGVLMGKGQLACREGNFVGERRFTKGSSSARHPLIQVSRQPDSVFGIQG